MSRLPDDVCPRCGAARAPDQEYCLECGLRLPPTGGRMAGLRRGWVRRLGWYPGDWIWTTLLAFVIAAAGAGVAIAVTTNRSPSNTGTTFAATNPNVPLTTPTVGPGTTFSVDTSTLPTPPEPTSTSAKPKPQPANGATPWPPSQSGWTVVLESEPATPGGRVRANARAEQAVKAGLPEVGVLVSSRFASLHPGYLVVFAGVYDSQRQAQSTLNAAYAAGFSSAYVRQIVE